MTPTICRFRGMNMRHRWIGVPVAVLPLLLTAQTARGPEAQAERVSYARIGFMRALDESHTVDLEAGYIRHLQWHRQVKDPFNWYQLLGGGIHRTSAVVHVRRSDTQARS